jgi:hypothetical protein
MDFKNKTYLFLEDIPCYQWIFHATLTNVNR